MSLKSIAEAAAHTLGAIDLIRRKNRTRVRILVYHRFNGSPSTVRDRLAAQCSHLRRHFHPVSMDELVEAALQNAPLPANSLAITVDDGYRDFEIAFPIFQEFGFRVTLYVVANFSAGELWLWPDQLRHLLQASPRSHLAIPLPEGTTTVSLADKHAAFESISQGMIRMPNSQRLSLLHSLPELLDAELPLAAPADFAPLSFAQLRTMASSGLDIGAHTRTHPILSKLASATELEEEILGSKLRIETATGATVNHFCYPNGKLPDVDEAVVAATRKAGYLSATLAEPGFAGPPFHLFRLNRIGIDPSYPRHYFERCVAGYRL